MVSQVNVQPAMPEDLAAAHPAESGKHYDWLQPLRTGIQQSAEFSRL